MSITIAPTITFNGIEAREAILEKAFYKPAFTKIHSVYPGIIAKEQIAFMERFYKITLKDAGCGTGKSIKELPLHQKFWNPVEAKIWLQPCWNDLKAQFFIWSMKKGYNRADLDDTLFTQYIMDILRDGAMEDLFRMVWFSDTNITDVDDTPAGTLTLAADVKYYNFIDALWKQIFDGVSIGVGTWGHIPRYTIALNSQPTEALQLALTLGDSKTIFKKLITNADSRLRYAKNKVILCTDTLFQDWLDYKESKVLESSFKKEDSEFWEGIFRSCRIIPVDLWDRVIKADFDNGTTLHLPHRAILTTIDQIAVGFDAPDDVTYFDAFLDKVTELYNIKGAYRFDAKILENYLFSVAY